MKNNVSTYSTTMQNSFNQRVQQDLLLNKTLYIMVLPVIVYYILFKYLPMYGAIMAFKDFSPRLGVWGSPWIGFRNFIDFFTGPFAYRVIKNTLVISLTTLAFGFPAPIILALLLNEIKSIGYKRIVQTASYLPYFISLVVVCGMIKDFTSDSGVINSVLVSVFGRFGYEAKTFLNESSLFVPVYVVSDIWQSVGWGSIIYLAALAGVDEELYEAAKIDGAGRWKQTVHITIPCIMPTIIIMLILRMGNIMNVGFEKIILLQNELIYDTSDVIASFVYRRGLIEHDYSFSTAVDLFNAVTNCILLMTANFVGRKLSDTSLW